ncbi:hypothetical protein D3C83_75010 [compost metagenome]
MKPVQQHGTEARHQAIGDAARAVGAMLLVLRLQRAEHRAAGAHHVHRMRRLGELFEDGFEWLWQPSQ